jgi:phosphate transport system permease protein
VRLAGQLASGLLIAFVALLALDLFVRGAPEWSAGYLFEPVREGGTAGGIGPVLLSTFFVVLLAMVIALPLGLGAAILSAEILVRQPRKARAILRSFEALASAPSVAIGLVGWTLFGRLFGLGFSILSGGLTLAIMLVPILAVAFHAGLEAVPRALRAQSQALGVSRWNTLVHLVLPAARPALFAGVVLGLGRATAETAVLMLTSGISTRMPHDAFDPGATLAVHVYHLARNVPGGEARAYAAACALFLVNVAVHLSLARMRKEPV